MFDDKDLKTGDELSFVNKDTKKEFAQAKILSLTEKEFDQLTEDDWAGHEKYSSEQEMYNAFQSFYPEEIIDKHTKVKIIKFKLK